MKKQPAARLVPLLLLLFSAAVILPRRNTLTAQAILRLSPNSRVLSGAFLLILFTCKGVSFFFPLAVLEAAGGALFPLRLALPLNLLGAGLAMTAPFFLGRRDRDGLTALLTRYPKLRALQALRREGDFFFVWFLRMAGVFPFDLVSFYLGAAGLPFGTCLAAGLLGVLPHLAAVTYLGTALTCLRLRTACTAVGVNVAVSVAALALRYIRQKKRAA